MPIFIDRHNAEGMTPADMAEGHRLDLDAQETHDVRFLSAWFDPGQGLAFCLADAPTAACVTKVHAIAHGNTPTDIMEVDLDEVLAYLGQAAEPDPDDPLAEDFRFDSAFRTILFTDLVDSVALTMHLGDARAIELLDRHDQAISSAIEPHGGRIVKHTGDGFLISFDEVDEALRAAVRIQRDVSPLHDLLAVKIGINPGNPVERGEDLFGMTVQIAARVCERADPSRILVTGIVRELSDDPALADFFVDRGRVPLKGYESALQLYEVDWRAG